MFLGDPGCIDENETHQGLSERWYLDPSNHKG
jgi:hypothetical protein